MSLAKYNAKLDVDRMNMNEEYLVTQQQLRVLVKDAIKAHEEKQKAEYKDPNSYHRPDNPHNFAKPEAGSTCVEGTRTGRFVNKIYDWRAEQQRKVDEQVWEGDKAQVEFSTRVQCKYCKWWYSQPEREHAHGSREHYIIEEANSRTRTVWSTVCRPGGSDSLVPSRDTTVAAAQPETRTEAAEGDVARIPASFGATGRAGFLSHRTKLLGTYKYKIKKWFFAHDYNTKCGSLTIECESGETIEIGLR